MARTKAKNTRIAKLIRFMESLGFKRYEGKITKCGKSICNRHAKWNLYRYVLCTFHAKQHANMESKHA